MRLKEKTKSPLQPENILLKVISYLKIFYFFLFQLKEFV